MKIGIIFTLLQKRFKSYLKRLREKMSRTIAKVVHLTSVHSRIDVRIFLKECESLARHRFDVNLVVADGKMDEEKNGVKIYDVGKPNSRLQRMFFFTEKIYAKAVELDADIYHLHDPELLPVSLRLLRSGKKVIYDAHEDVEKQMLAKPYLNKLLLKIVASVFAKYEKFVCRKLDCIIAATPFIRNKFLKINKHSVDINNFPVLGELNAGLNGKKERKNQVCYVGGISPIRGCNEIVEAIGLVKNDVFLSLAGKISDSATEENLKSKEGWYRVNSLGFLNRTEVCELLSSSIAGLVTLRPIINYLDSLPVKMFEYMSAGLPVIASNFPLWREIIEGNKCGVCVDPLKPESIAEAIDWIYENPIEAEKMGKNGQKAVLEKYNWKNEEQKLLKIYEKVTL